MGSSYRKRLAAQAKISPAEMLVNELFIGDHGRINSTCATINRHRTGGFQQHLCYMTFTEQCSYKYLLNSASIGYANKFKYLLLCGCMQVLTTAPSLPHRYAPVRCSTNERAQSARGSVPETARRTHLQRMLQGLQQSPPPMPSQARPSQPSQPSASAAMATPPPQYLYCRHRRLLASPLHLGFRFTRWRRRERSPPKHDRRVDCRPRSRRRRESRCCRRRYGSRRRGMACVGARIILPVAVRATPREEGPPLWEFWRERHCCALRGTI